MIEYALTAGEEGLGLGWGSLTKPFFCLNLGGWHTVKKLIKLLARGLGAASLAALLSSGSTSPAAPVEEPTSASFQAPAKRLVLDYDPLVLAKSGQADAQRLASHSSHSSHRSHYSGR